MVIKQHTYKQSEWELCGKPRDRSRVKRELYTPQDGDAIRPLSSHMEERSKGQFLPHSSSHSKIKTVKGVYIKK